MIKYKNIIIGFTAVVTAVATLYVYTDDVIYFQYDYRMVNAPVPQWLSRQIAELEIYMRTYC